jgi:hypothetical protein
MMAILDAVLAEQHTLGGEKGNSEPTRFCIVLADRPLLRVVALGADHVAFDQELLCGAEMGAFGRIEVTDVTERVASTLRAQEVGEPRCIHDGRGKPIGVAIAASSPLGFCIWRENDEFKFGAPGDLRKGTFPPWIQPAMAYRALVW